uniref:Uncharacterized protein n=1 Tax=Hyaloperonospora arabidopsidis (strain Emoy2) TaxID=559515 RepID=M4BHQ2_HYAAE
MDFAGSVRSVSTSRKEVELSRTENTNTREHKTLSCLRAIIGIEEENLSVKKPSHIASTSLLFEELWSTLEKQKAQHRELCSGATQLLVRGILTTLEVT